MINIHYKFKSSNTAKGTTAEMAVAKHLRSLGWQVRRLRYGGTDLLATNPLTGERLRVEVKFSSRSTYDGKYRATTYKAGCTDHHKSDVIVFVCQNPYAGGQCTSFVIPCKAQGDKTSLCVTSNPVTYSGKLAVYKEAWPTVS